MCNDPWFQGVTGPPGVAGPQGPPGHNVSLQVKARGELAKNRFTQKHLLLLYDQHRGFFFTLDKIIFMVWLLFCRVYLEGQERRGHRESL